MSNKTIILILIAIIIALVICIAALFLGNTNNADAEYETYTVNGTGTTIEIPVNSKIAENDELINITSDHVYVLIYKNVNESKTASMAANTDIMDEKLNKETKELVQVFSYNEQARNHIIESIKFGKAIKNDEEKTTKTVTQEVDHSKDPVYCSLCGAYVTTQGEIDDPNSGEHFQDPSTGETICYKCAEKLIEEDEDYGDYEIGEQKDGSYIDPDDKHWNSYDEYLYISNHPSN